MSYDIEISTQNQERKYYALTEKGKNFYLSNRNYYIKSLHLLQIMIGDDYENRISNNKKRVRNELKNRKIIDEKIVEEFTQTCFDDYNLSLENGESKNDALKSVFSALTETLDSSNLLNHRSNPYHYSLVLSLVSFVVCFIIALIGWLCADVLDVYGVIYPLCLLAILIVLVFTIANYKKRNKVDFLIVTLIFIAVVIINIECFMFFYRARTGNFYYSLNYNFPGLLKFNRYVLTSSGQFKYEISETILLFNQTLIVSLISLIISIIFNIIEKQRKIC